jgi:hypothetical protein
MRCEYGALGYLHNEIGDHSSIVLQHARTVGAA